MDCPLASKDDWRGVDCPLTSNELKELHRNMQLMNCLMLLRISFCNGEFKVHIVLVGLGVDYMTSLASSEVVMGPVWLHALSHDFLPDIVDGVTTSVHSSRPPAPTYLLFDKEIKVYVVLAKAWEDRFGVPHQVKKLKVYLDSALETCDTKLIPYHNHVKEMIEYLDMITFHHVPREENQMANALTTLSAMVQVNEGQEVTIHV
ncbi:hypothetical protein CR513_44668, partial [Mucuna pruriens]